MTKLAAGAPVVAERLGRAAAGTAGTRRAPTMRDRRRRDRPARPPARSRRPSRPYMAADRRADEAQRHRDREERAAHVVAAAQDDRAAGDRPPAPARAGSPSAIEHRHEHAARVPDRLPRTARARSARSPASTPPSSLNASAISNSRRSRPQRCALRVAEAVLDERLLDREVEEQLEEGGRGEDGGEAGRNRATPELARRDDRRQEAERPSPCRPRSPSPSVARGHGSASVAPSIVAPLGLPFARRGPAAARAGGRDPAPLPAPDATRRTPRSGRSTSSAPTSRSRVAAPPRSPRACCCGWAPLRRPLAALDRRRRAARAARRLVLLDAARRTRRST